MDNLILKFFLPEVFLSVTILLHLLFNTSFVLKNNNNFPLLEKENSCQLHLILYSLAILFFNNELLGITYKNVFLLDINSYLIKIVTTIILILLTNIIIKSHKINKLNFFEFFTLMLLSILSLYLLISANNLMVLYLIIELQALCFYLLAGFKRSSLFSSESGIKYFITGSIFSSIFLLGASICYWCLGTLNIYELKQLMLFKNSIVVSSNINLWLLFGVILILFTFLFKLSCAPFHFWAPDAYEGSPLASTIIFSIVPKLPTMCFLIKFIFCINSILAEFSSFIIGIGFFSILCGTFFAISQKRFKRFIIYSSISQVGFIVICLCFNNYFSTLSIFMFLINYILSSITIWGLYLSFNNFRVKLNFYYSKDSSFFINDFSTSFKRTRIWCYALIIVFFSVAGIPPVFGFLAKAYVLIECFSNEYASLTIAILLIAAISTFYYIRIIKVAAFEPDSQKTKKILGENVIFYDSDFDKVFISCSIGCVMLVFLYFISYDISMLCEYTAITSFS